MMRHTSFIKPSLYAALTGLVNALVCAVGAELNSGNASFEVVTNISQLHRLAQDTPTNLIIRLEGDVCWSDASKGDLVIQDDTGTIFVETGSQISCAAGQRVVMEGLGTIADQKLQARVLVNNDGVHAGRERSGTFSLKAGRYPIKVGWFDSTGEYDLEVFYQGPGILKQLIPDAALYHLAKNASSRGSNWVQGLEYRSYEGQWDRVPDFSRVSPVKSGAVANFDKRLISRTNYVGLEFTGFINLPQDGEYTFTLKSDDGSILSLEGQFLQFKVVGTQPALRLPKIVPGLSQVGTQWGEVEGTVRFVTRYDQGAQLDLESKQQLITVRVVGADPDRLIRYLGLPIRISGLAETIMNDQGKRVIGSLWCPSPEAIPLSKPTQAEWQAWPTYALETLTAVHAGQAAKRIDRYAITSANDYPSRDPKDWQLWGSNDEGKNWAILDQRRGEVFENRFQRRIFAITNTHAYNLYRLQIDSTALALPGSAPPTYEDKILQLAEIEFLEPSGSERAFEVHTEKKIAAKSDYPPAETKEMAFDGKVKTKWLDHDTNSWIQAQYVWINVPTNRVIKVFGHVIEHSNGAMILEAGQSRLTVRSDQPFALAVGQEVAAAGFLAGKGAAAELVGAYLQLASEARAMTSDDAADTGMVLTNAAQILQLSREEQVRKIPVHLRGTVTCYIDADVQNYFESIKTIQDATGGIGIHWGWYGPGRPGDFVDLIGHLEAWANAPVVFVNATNATTVLGRGIMPKPGHPSWEALRTGKPENQWIELRGVVHSAEKDRFVLKVKGGQLAVRVASVKPDLLRQWVDALVSVRGVYHIVYNKSFQMQSFMLETPGIEHVQVEKPAPMDPFGLPILPVMQLLRSESLDALEHRMKVAGVVTYGEDSFCYLQDDSGVMKAYLTQAAGLKAGDRVELVGFPEPGGQLPVFVDALVRKLGSGEAPPTTPLAMKETLKATHEGRRIRLEALCLGQGVRGPNQIIELLADRQTFRALLSDQQGRLPEIPTGSRIEVSGVCQVEAGPLRQPGQTVTTFELLMNSPSDVLIIERPPWWTWKHTVAIGGLMGIILAGAVFWIRTLRRKVDERTLALKEEIEEHKRTEVKLQEKTELLAEEIEERKTIQDDLVDKKNRLETEIEERKRLEEEKERIHKQLLATSRQAGMAEVATGVLHNVGNVLNSVNVAATLIAEKTTNSRISSLAKLDDLLNLHTDDLADFITRDAKGRQIPSFVKSLSEHLQQERAEVLKEVASLTHNIDHIKEIVAMQQSYARVSGVVEVVPVRELVEDALKMHSGAYLRHTVRLEREYADVPPMTTDKHKVLQILVNVLHNAKYACDESGRADKHVAVRIARAGEDRVRIEVADNGIGIPAENLTKIFGHGFTTRKDGHGFGLHSGANAAKELGGTLTAHSDGHGQGATFTLELPLQAKTDG